MASWEFKALRRGLTFSTAEGILPADGFYAWSAPLNLHRPSSLPAYSADLEPGSLLTLSKIDPIALWHHIVAGVCGRTCSRGKKVKRKRLGCHQCFQGHIPSVLKMPPCSLKASSIAQKGYAEYSISKSYLLTYIPCMLFFLFCGCIKKREIDHAKKNAWHTEKEAKEF